MALDEQAKRRPDFLGGRPITLADGQDWSFPLPEVAYVRTRDDRGFKTRSQLGPEYDALAEAYRNAESGPDVIRSELALAEWLLLRNYDLTLEEIQALVQFHYGEDIVDETRDAILDVVLGRNGPKQSSDGLG